MKTKNEKKYKHLKNKNYEKFRIFSIKSEIDRKKNAEKNKYLKIGIIYLLIGIMILKGITVSQADLENTGVLILSIIMPLVISLIFMAIAAISIFNSFRTSAEIEKKYEKLEEMRQKNINAEDAVTEILKEEKEE